MRMFFGKTMSHFKRCESFVRVAPHVARCRRRLVEKVVVCSRAGEPKAAFFDAID